MTEMLQDRWCQQHIWGSVPMIFSRRGCVSERFSMPSGELASVITPQRNRMVFYCLLSFFFLIVIGWCPAAQNRTVEKTTTAVKFSLAEGVGIHGTYSVSVTVNVTDDQVLDRHLIVSIESAASQQGTMSFLGAVQFYKGDEKKPYADGRLVRAWFKTIGSDTVVSRFMEKGKVVDIPAGEKVRCVISISPTLSQPGGTTPLGGTTVEVILNDPEISQQEEK